MRIASSAPTRIDLAGGTFDIWPLYLFHDRAVTLNAAISLRARCELTARDDRRVTVTSADTGEQVEAATAAALPLDRLPLVTRLARHFDVGGVDIRTASESPVGAGIAGSSAMAIALSAALSAWVDRAVPDEQLLDLAMNVEAQVLQVPTGVQDLRPALFGGVAAIEMDLAGVRRVPLPVDASELTRRIVLAYTNASRQSGINNWQVMTRRIDGDPDVTRAFDGIRDAAIALRTALERSDWTAAGAAIQQEWTERQRLSPTVSTPVIDDLLRAAADAGASAGKVCGAGGGGCLFCLVPPERHAAVSTALAARGARVLAVTVDAEGLRLERTA